MVRRISYFVIFILLVSSPTIFAGEFGDTLKARMERLYELPLDTTTALSLSDVTLTHQDMTLTIDSGRMAYFQMPELAGNTEISAMYVEGRLHFTFTPTPSVERGQLRRFFDRDSLDVPVSAAILFCRADFVKSLKTSVALPFSRDDAKSIGKRLGSLDDFDKAYSYRFSIVQASLYQAERPFLYAFVQPEEGDQLQYIFDPFERERVQLRKSYRRPGIDAMELICSYATDSRHSGGFDGLPRERCHASHYKTNGQIDRNGKYSGSAEITITADSALRVIAFDFHEMLKVDSVVAPSGAKLTFSRYKNLFRYWYAALNVYLDSTLPAGSTITLTAYYSGDVAERWGSEFVVNAGAMWYPRVGWLNRATFDMTFRTIREFAFVACGTKTSEREVGDTLITTWAVKVPTHNVSFAIGNLKKYEFDDPAAGVLDIYVNDEIRKSDRKMANAVSEDLISAGRFFKERFGSLPYSRITATEILDRHGEAFVGFLHLGYNTFTSTKEFGVEATFRAHELAHQWWGVEVGWDTYHDQWLSEGFSTYCALMYVQATQGNDVFVSKLIAGRKEINGVRNYIFGSGAESGPIYLGYRTSSTKTEGDYQLIIYKKAALVLHMLRTMMLDLTTLREDRFFAMMRDFYESYRGKSASTDDFRRVVERHVGEEMGWFFDQWVYGTDIPTIDFSYTLEPGENGAYTAKCKMVTSDVRADFFAYIPVEIQLDDKAKAYVRAVIDKPVTEFALTLPHKPKGIKLNPGEAVLANVNQ